MKKKLWDFLFRKKKQVEGSNKISILNSPNSRLVRTGLYLGNKCEYGKKIEVLNEVETNLFVLVMFSNEVCSGGYYGFIYHAGHLYHESITALEVINHENEVNHLKELLNFIPNALVPKDFHQREVLLTEALEVRCQELELLFKADDLVQSIYNYMILNKQEIR